MFASLVMPPKLFPPYKFVTLKFCGLFDSILLLETSPLWLLPPYILVAVPLVRLILEVSIPALLPPPKIFVQVEPSKITFDVLVFVSLPPP